MLSGRDFALQMQNYVVSLLIAGFPSAASLFH